MKTMTKAALMKKRLARGESLQAPEAPGCMCGSGAILYRTKRHGLYVVASSIAALESMLPTINRDRTNGVNRRKYDRKCGAPAYRFVFVYATAAPAKEKFAELAAQQAEENRAERARLQAQAKRGDIEAINSLAITA